MLLKVKRKEKHFITFSNSKGEVRSVICRGYDSLTNAHTAASIIGAMSWDERRFCFGDLHDPRFIVGIETHIEEEVDIIL